SLWYTASRTKEWGSRRQLRDWLRLTWLSSLLTLQGSQCWSKKARQLRCVYEIVTHRKRYPWDKSLDKVRQIQAATRINSYKAEIRIIQKVCRRHTCLSGSTN